MTSTTVDQTAEITRLNQLLQTERLEREQIANSLEAEARKSAEERDLAVGQLEEAKAKQATAEAVAQKATKEKDEAVSRFNEIQRSYELSRQERDRLFTEKTSLSEQLKQVTTSYARATSEIEKLEQKMQELANQKVDLSVKLADSEARGGAAETKAQRLDKQCETLKRELERALKIQEEKTHEIVEIKHNASRNEVDLQTRLDSATDHMAKAEESVLRLREQCRALEKALDEKASDARALRDAANNQSESAKEELEAAKRLATLYCESVEAEKKKTQSALKEVSKLNEILAETANALKKSAEDAEEERKKVIESDEKIKELRERIESLEQQAKSSAPIPPFITEEKLDSLHRSFIEIASATKSKEEKGANTTEEQQISKMEVAKLEARVQDLLREGQERNHVLVSALNTERANKAVLEANLAFIHSQLEEKMPQIESDRKAFAELIQVHSSLEKSFEEAKIQIKNLQIQIEEYRSQINPLKTRCSNLSLQVRHLLKQILDDSERRRHEEYMISIGGSDEYNNNQQEKQQEEEEEEGGGGNENGSLITFANIGELQEQNEKLLSKVKELSEAFQSVKSQESQAEIKKLNEHVRMLTEQHQRELEKANAIRTERDMLRERLNITNKVSPAQNSYAILQLQKVQQQQTNQESFEQLYSELKKAFEEYRKEKQETEKALQSALEKAREEASKARLDLARCESRAQCIEERFHRLEASEKQSNDDIKRLQKSNAVGQSQSAAQLTQIQELNKELSELRLQKASLESRISSLQSQNETVRQAETRWIEENRRLISENNRISKALEEVSAACASKESLETSTRNRQEKELSEATGHCNELRKQLENLRAVSESTEHNLRIQIDDLQARLRTSETDLGNLRVRAAETSSRESAIREEMKLAFDKLKLQQQEKEQQQTSATTNTPTTNDLDRNIHLENEILKSKLKTTQEELAQEKLLLEETRAIAKSATGAQNDLGMTFEAYKQEINGKLSATQEEANQIRIKLEESETQLKSERKKWNEEREAFEAEKASLQEHIKKAEQQLATIGNELQQRDNKLISLREEMSANAKALEESQAKYMREVVAHAEDLKISEQCKAAASAASKALENERNRATIAECSLRELEISTKELSEHQSKQITELENRIKDLSRSYNSALSQLSIANERQQRTEKQLLDMVESRSATSTTASQSSSNNSNNSSVVIDPKIKELNELVAFSMREKEIAECKLVSTQQETSRLRIKVEELTTQLSKEASKIDDILQTYAGVPTAAEYKAVLEKLEQLPLFRESNESLRRETLEHIERASKLQEKINELVSKLEAATTTINETKADCEILRSQNKTLKENNTHWEERFNSMLEQNRIAALSDTRKAEIERLNNECEKLRQMVTSSNSVSEKLRNELSSAKEQVEQQKQALQQVSQQREIRIRRAGEAAIVEQQQQKKQHEELEKANSTVEGLHKQLAECEQKVAQVQAENNSNKKMIEMLEKYKKIVQKLNEKNHELYINLVRELGFKSKQQQQQSSAQQSNNSVSSTTAEASPQAVISPTEAAATTTTSATTPTIPHLNRVLHQLQPQQKRQLQETTETNLAQQQKQEVEKPIEQPPVKSQKIEYNKTEEEQQQQQQLKPQQVQQIETKIPETSQQQNQEQVIANTPSQIQIQIPTASVTEQKKEEIEEPNVKRQRLVPQTEVTSTTEPTTNTAVEEIIIKVPEEKQQEQQEEEQKQQQGEVEEEGEEQEQEVEPMEERPQLQQQEEEIPSQQQNEATMQETTSLPTITAELPSSAPAISPIITTTTATTNQPPPLQQAPVTAVKKMTSLRNIKASSVTQNPPQQIQAKPMAKSQPRGGGRGRGMPTPKRGMTTKLHRQLQAQIDAEKAVAASKAPQEQTQQSPQHQHP